MKDRSSPLSGEVTVLMPCLNEARTIRKCITDAQKALRLHDCSGEVLVCDNGSTDNSVELAIAVGARVVTCEKKGYGHAIRCGVENAHGQIIVMADADGSYDFLAIGPFIDLLRSGADVVIGNRFQGGIQPGAMPWKNQYVGNPVLSGLVRLFFRCSVHDAHCGMRSFTRTAYELMKLRTGGMEFATEQILRAIQLRLTIAETPVVLYPDGRDRRSHLRPWRDGCRHLHIIAMHYLRDHGLIRESSVFLSLTPSDS